MNNQTKKWEIKGKLSGVGGSKTNEKIVELLLKNRGITTAKNRQEFFAPTRPEKITLKDLGIKEDQVKKAIARIKLAKKKKEKVIVYGDYDADGICGTAVLWECLYSLGLNALPYIPERFSEGYGLNIDSIKKLKNQDPQLKLIITVDHGIVASKNVDLTKKLGIDIIISDHHVVGKIKPKAYGLIHTLKVSGSAVAWILAREIYKSFKSAPSDIKNGLELTAIGTIADQLPLVGHNRSFARYGLRVLNKTKRFGLLSLFEEAAIKAGEIGPYAVGFLIAPRINAAGRLTHAINSLRLLCTKDKKRAHELAMHLGKTNLERQKIVDEVVLHAKGKLKGQAGQKIIIIAHESYHEGVIGLAAAKLVEEFYRPVIVFSQKSAISKASARSISGFNIIETIRRLDALYLEGGGHPMAAGFLISTEKIAEFTKQINTISGPLLTEEILTKKLKIDLEIPFTSLNNQLVNKIKSFEPTGLGNPAPTFCTKAVEIVEARMVGRENRHLKLKLKKDSATLEAIAFGLGNYYQENKLDKPIDIAYCLEENEWNGRKSLQLKIKDIN